MIVELEVSLRDLYLGASFQVRDVHVVHSQHIFIPSLQHGQQGLSLCQSYIGASIQLQQTHGRLGLMSTACQSVPTHAALVAISPHAEAARCTHRARLIRNSMHTPCGDPQVTRDKNVIKPAPGKRECNCKARVVTRQLGPGM